MRNKAKNAMRQQTDTRKSWRIDTWSEGQRKAPNGGQHKTSSRIVNWMELDDRLQSTLVVQTAHLYDNVNRMMGETAQTNERLPTVSCASKTLKCLGKYQRFPQSNTIRSCANAQRDRGSGTVAQEDGVRPSTGRGWWWSHKKLRPRAKRK